MKAVMIEGYMESGHFNVPGWCGKREITYPLPPFSTVIGMVHSLCKWKSYHPMNISVSGQGILSKARELRWKGGLYSSVATDEFQKRFPVHVKNGKGVVGWVSVPVDVDFLIDLRLRLHIVPEDNSDLEEISSSLLYPPVFPSLGRYADLIRIDNVETVDVYCHEKEIQLDLDMYYQGDEYSGTFWNIHKDYKIIRNRRVFNDKRVIVLSAGQNVSAPTDSYGNPVFLI